MIVEAYLANWDKHGRAAGPFRNQQMLYEREPEIYYGFHQNIEKSHGTKDMVSRCVKAGITYKVIY